MWQWALGVDAEGEPRAEPAWLRKVRGVCLALLPVTALATLLLWHPVINSRNELDEFILVLAIGGWPLFVLLGGLIYFRATR